MDVLDSAVPMLFVASTDLDRSIGFYRDTLGLTLHAQDAHAAIFQLGAATLLRVVPVDEFTAASYPVLSWDVPDVTAAVQRLGERGVAFTRVDGPEQDELAIWTTPGGSQVAWFTDPDGSILSLSHHGKEKDFKEFLAAAPDLSELEIDRSSDVPR
jgi:catechol 2,3-dioxygenase-like lactoylglutathione lyase family enzyme